ncbi:MAG: apolipoprotein N-acyltransferase [Pirellulales bacterium]|nr:apolipoprotein N-acyltransferase [Pirellulales bacterium]
MSGTLSVGQRMNLFEPLPARGTSRSFAAESPPVAQASQSTSAWMFTAPIGSALLLALCFPPLEVSWLAWVALAPMAAVLARPRGTCELYLGAFLGGLSFHLLGLDWLRTSEGGLGIAGPHVAAWFWTGVFFAVAWLALVWLGRRFVAGSAWPMTLALPIVWVAWEYLRYHLWLLVSETRFPWLQLGTTQVAQLTGVQIADLTGVWGIGALVAMINGLVFDAWRACRSWRDGLSRHRLAVSAASSAVVLAAAGAYGTWRLGQSAGDLGPAICLMPADSTPVGARPQTRPEQSVAPWSPESPNSVLLLWSEGVIDLDSNEIVRRLERFANERGVTLAVGCRRVDAAAVNRPSFNSVAVFDARSGYQGCYDKVCLVPRREFVPWFDRYVLRKPAGGFSPGTRYPTFTVPSSEGKSQCSFAATICYDSCFAPLYRRFMQSRESHWPPDFFVVSSCESVDLTFSVQRSILAQARLRAIECRRAVVRNVDCGYSGIIDGCGRLVAAPPGVLLGEPTPLGPVPLDSRTSLYVYGGDWLPMAAVAVLVAVCFWPRGRKRDVGSMSI